MNEGHEASWDQSTKEYVRSKKYPEVRDHQASREECVFENYFSYFSTKTYVVGTQKNRLNETVLFSTQNIRYN